MQYPGALRRWVTAGPQIARLLKSFEQSMTSKNADCMDHHEQSHAPEKKTSAEINVQALVFLFCFLFLFLRKLVIHLKKMEDASSPYTPKSL